MRITMRSMKQEALEWTKAISCALLVVCLCNSYLLQVHRIQGQSMLPTLEPKQLTLLWKAGGAPQAGDIVVIDPRIERSRSTADALLDNFLFAPLTGEYWIKRVIGLPSDTMELRGGLVYRNGELLKEPYLLEPMTGMPDVTFTVPEDSVFVMGDNRNHSFDSRAVGPVPLTHVLGSVLFY